MEATQIYNDCVVYASYIVEYTCEFIKSYPIIYNIIDFVDTYYTEILCGIIYSNIISLITIAICFGCGFGVNQTKTNNTPVIKTQQRPEVQYANASTQYEFDDIDDLIIEIRNVYSKNPKRIVTLTTRATHKVVTHSKDYAY